MKRLMIFLAAMSLVFAWCARAGAEVLEPYPENPWYWSYAGQPLMLRGASDDDNLFQWTGEELTGQLDLLVSKGGNYVRNTMSDRDDGNIRAFAKSADGLYDLDQWNESYWDRLEFFLQQTRERGIIVQLTLWDVFDRNHDDDAFAGRNNVNYADEVIGGIDAFYATVANGNETGLRYQRRYIDRLLETTLQYDHVLYNIDNESRADETWENYWAAHTHSAASKVGRHVYVTTMKLDPSNSVRAALTFPELYGYAEISQNSQDSRGARGPAHWQNIMFWRELVAAGGRGPMPMNNVKIYGAGSAENFSAGTENEAVHRFWRNVFAGAASSRFHRPASTWGSGLNERVQANLQAMDMFLEEFDIFAAQPTNNVFRPVVAARSEAMEAYVLADIGNAYAVYFPRGRYLVGLDPWVYAEKVSVRWLDIEALVWTAPEIIDVPWEGDLYDWGDRTSIMLKTPGNGSYVALVEVVDPDHSRAVKLSEVEWHGTDCYRIEIPMGTVYFEKGNGASGFKSFIDPEGNDWIASYMEPGPNGDFRGFPNSVGNFGHAGRDSGSTTVVVDGRTEGDYVVLESTNGTFTFQYWFFPDRISIKVLKSEGDYTYLLEGVMGGTADAEDFFVTANGERHIPSGEFKDFTPEWFYLGDPKSNYYLFLAKSPDDDAPNENHRQIRPGGLHNMDLYSFGRTGKEEGYEVRGMSGNDHICVIGFASANSSREKMTRMIEGFLAQPFEKE